MGSYYMEATQINYRRDETFKTVDQKLQELSETSAIDTDIAPVFSKTATYNPGDMVYYKNKLYVFNVEHTGAWAAADVTATDVTTEVSSLRSGLTNYENQNNLNLEVPNRKNVLPMTVESIKAANTSGTWSVNTYTDNGISYAINTDANGNISSIDISGTNTANSQFNLTNKYILNKYRGMIINGYNGGSNEEDSQNELYIAYSLNGSSWDNDEISYNGDTTLTKDFPYIFFMIIVRNQTNYSKTVYPMVRPAFIADDTFAPYIPSVEARLDAVESGLIKQASETITTDGNSWLRFPAGKQIINAYTTGFNTLVIAKDAYGYYARYQIPNNTSNASLVMLTAGTDYTVTYDYI